MADAIYDEPTGIDEACTVVDPLNPTRRKAIAAGTPYEDLLVPVFRNGDAVYESPPLDRIRARARNQLACLHSGIKRFVNPHEYPVGLEPRLSDLRTRLTLETRGRS